MRVGCSYGGRFTRFSPWLALVAFVAQALDRPVRCRLRREEDIRISGQRGEFIGNYSVGVKEGKIMGAKFELSKNAGWNADNSPDILSCAMLHIDNSYSFPAMDVSGNVFITNTPRDGNLRFEVRVKSWVNKQAGF